MTIGRVGVIAGRGRSGITLTEILISILIMGVGLISLATLFPLGLLRIRDAQRNSRSGYLFESAQADLNARGLLKRQVFGNFYFVPWNNVGPNNNTFYTPRSYDPFVQDTPSYGGDPQFGVLRTANSGEGLPIAYDPLWRFVTGSYPQGGAAGTAEGRFADGTGFVRHDPNPGNGGNSNPSADGLQRLTNFNPLLTYPAAVSAGNPVVFPANTVPSIFVSPEDIITQADAGGQQVTGASPIVPAMTVTSGSQVYDNEWRFSWMFTGHADPTKVTDFEGDIVIFENRPFGIDQVSTPFGGNRFVATGETVVEAVFGFSTKLAPLVAGASTGYGIAASRIVLLRWPSTMPDPDVKVGQWIADVTYERVLANQAARQVTPDYPLQRCYWYQIVKRSDPDFSSQREGSYSTDSGTYRSMVVWVATPLKALTLMNGNASPVQPVHCNAALICPSVVYVYPASVSQ